MVGLKDMNVYVGGFLSIIGKIIYSLNIGRKWHRFNQKHAHKSDVFTQKKQMNLYCYWYYSLKFTVLKFGFLTQFKTYSDSSYKNI